MQLILKRNIEITGKYYQVIIDTLFDSIIFLYDTVTVKDTLFIKRLTNKDFWFIYHDNHSQDKYYYYKYSSEE